MMVFEVSTSCAQATSQPAVTEANYGSLIRTSTSGVKSLNRATDDDISAYARASTATETTFAFEEIVGLAENTTLPMIRESTRAEMAPIVDTKRQNLVLSDSNGIERRSITQGSLESPNKSDDPTGALIDELWRNPIKEFVMQNHSKPIRRGFLFKEKRRWTKKWKYCYKYFYFVLSPLKIECYLSGSTATLFDEMSFSDRRCSVRSLPGTQRVIFSTAGSQLTNEYLLELRAGSQEWVLAFMSELEKKEWLSALQLVFDALKSARSVQRSSICALETQKMEQEKKPRPTAHSDGVIMDFRSRFSYSQSSFSVPKVYATVLSAENLAERGKTVNALCEMKLGTQGFQTGVVHNERSPQWNRDNKVVFTALSDCLDLKIRVLDEVYPRSFRLIAKLSVPLSQLPNLELVEMDFPLMHENGSFATTLKLSLKYVDEVKDLHCRLREALNQFEDIARDDFKAKMEHQAKERNTKLDNALTLCLQMNEAENAAKGVHARLVDLHEMILSVCVDESAQQSNTLSQQVIFDRILWRFRTCLQTNSGKKLLTRLITNRALLDELLSLHEEIDEFIFDCNFLASNPLHNWKGQWEIALQDCFNFIQDVWEHKHSLLDHAEEITHADTFKLLLFECEKRESQYSEKETRLLRDVFQHVLQLSKLPRGSLSSWFIPRHEVDFNVNELIGRGAYSSVHQGTWFGILVAVKRVLLESDFKLESFQKEADIWHNLQHTHIVRLFGACDVGHPFFVSEYASKGTLSHYLYENHGKTWEKLYEVSLGLLYLHTKQNIVHGDLKCNNIIIAADETAKITDFGLSFKINEPRPAMDIKSMGAIEWKAPEILSGESTGTFASDVYSLGMCIVEAVKGENPWGSFLYSAVKNKVLKECKLPNRPDGMSDPQWELVEQMCAFKASDRIDIATAARSLKEFALQECCAIEDAKFRAWSCKRQEATRLST